jgi:hypothetical protein
MGQVKRGRDRREEAGEKGEDRRKTNLSVENENRKGSQRVGPRRSPAVTERLVNKWYEGCPLGK